MKKYQLSNNNLIKIKINLDDAKPVKRCCNSKCCRNSRARSTARLLETGRQALSRASTPRHPLSLSEADQDDDQSRNFPIDDDDSDRSLSLLVTVSDYATRMAVLRRFGLVSLRHWFEFLGFLSKVGLVRLLED